MIQLLVIVKIATCLLSVILASAIVSRDPGLRINRLMGLIPLLTAHWSGCEILSNLQTDPEIAGLVSGSIESLTNVFELAIQQAQQQGEIPSDKDARTLATYLVSSMSGLRNMVKAGADRETVKRIADITLSALV